MSFVKILDINHQFLKIASDKNPVDELSHEIERKLHDLDDAKDMPYEKPDIVKLIGSIENAKMNCLQGHMSAKQLYQEVNHKLSLFKSKHPGFDYMNDSAINAYYS